MDHALHLIVITTGHATVRGGVKTSLNWRVKSNVPDWVGVPEIVPTELVVVRVSPGGKPAADHVNGGLNAPPVAVMVVAV
jgi:hypothetical protein